MECTSLGFTGIKNIIGASLATFFTRVIVDQHNRGIRSNAHQTNALKSHADQSRYDNMADQAGI